MLKSLFTSLMVVLAVAASVQQLDEFRLSTSSGHISVLIEFLSHLMRMLLVVSNTENRSMNLSPYVTLAFLPMDQGGRS